jgi:hypothetical protein
MRITLHPFRAHAERLQWHQLRQHQKTGELRLYLDCPDYVSTQVETVLSSRGIHRLPIKGLQNARWTYRYSLNALPSTRERDCLELLEKVVTIRPPSGVNIAIALDYYKDPDSDPDPMQWKNTKAGELVSRAKYKKAPGALDDLTRELVSVVRRHPLLSGCDAVLSIPGHDALNESFSEQLARAVAADLGIPFERTGARRVTRPEAKAIGESDDLSNEFTVNSVVRGRPVLIVDDVLMSGRTMAAVANAARRAGAVAVCGLVGAKTLKKQARNDA